MNTSFTGTYYHAPTDANVRFFGEFGESAFWVHNLGGVWSQGSISNFIKTAEHLEFNFHLTGILWTIRIHLQFTYDPTIKCWVAKHDNSDYGIKTVHLNTITHEPGFFAEEGQRLGE